MTSLVTTTLIELSLKSSVCFGSTCFSFIFHLFIPCVSLIFSSSSLAIFFLLFSSLQLGLLLAWPSASPYHAWSLEPIVLQCSEIGPCDWIPAGMVQLMKGPKPPWELWWLAMSLWIEQRYSKRKELERTVGDREWETANNLFSCSRKPFSSFDWMPLVFFQAFFNSLRPPWSLKHSSGYSFVLWMQPLCCSQTWFSGHDGYSLAERGVGRVCLLQLLLGLLLKVLCVESAQNLLCLWYLFLE